MRSLVLAFVAITATAALLPAQGRGGRSGDVPPGHRPPPGLCRIWIDGVPPGRQPAPTRCSDAVRNRPANGRVIHGDDSRGRERWENDDDRRDRDDDDRDDRWERDDDRRYERDGKSKGKHRSKATRTSGTRPAGDVCRDRDRNGWCDWRDASGTRQERRTSDQCMDRNRDGRCDASLPPRVSKEDVLGAIFGLP